MDSMEIRRNAIIELINTHGTVKFSQIKKAFPNVSDMTLRTDLKALDDANQIIRIHGGAKSVQVVVGTDDFLNKRSFRNRKEKQMITEKSTFSFKTRYYYFFGFRKYSNDISKPFSGSVQSDLYKRT